MERKERTPSHSSRQRPSISKEAEVEAVEHAQSTNEELWLQGYDLLVGKSKEDLDKLNKKVVKKLDWRFLVTITAMLLMK